ncbi:origin of replication complex subunit 3 [Solanum dulcamara]|uniref:origin of replication complex subunit 3 n=1 Tax=Solanum dulcamara TaxID=45834 RepID=UPI002485E16D|nr:origin of replication complex subunit 3 [Solanum dulcamara]
MYSPNEHPPTDSLAENNLQPFFVLHKASKSSESTAISLGKPSKIRLDSSPKVSLNNEHKSENLKMEAFQCVWSKIESKIKDVLRSINADVFDEIGRWVRESFNEICSCRGPVDPSKSSLPYPFVHNGGLVKKLFTALVFTKNIETVDDILTFAELGLNLKSRGCYVANISSLDFSTKNGIGGCLRAFLRQLLIVDIEAADVSLLASWYSEHGKYEKPVVVIIEDLERCSGVLLSDFINMLSEWSVKIPIILIAGVATSADAPRNVLTSRALQYLSTSIFFLKCPAERLDAIIEAVLVKNCASFTVGHKVATFLRNYFLRQDGTVTSFVRALKMALVQQLSIEPLSFLLKLLVDEGDSKRSWYEDLANLPDELIKHSFELPSYRKYSVHRNNHVELNARSLGHGLSELQRLQELWRSRLMCLHEAGRYHKVALLDLYMEALDPELYNSRLSNHGCDRDKSFLSNNDELFKLQKAEVTNQVIRKIRDLPAAKLSQLLKSWERLTKGTIEVHEKIMELQSQMISEDVKSHKAELTDISKRHINRRCLNVEKDECTSNEKAVTLAGQMIRDTMQPIECIPFHELICFKDVDNLQSALAGDPRRRIQIDLLNFYKILKCGCCSNSGGTLSPSMHDTSIMYTLAQEHGDLINLHDWFQSFKASISSSGKKGLKKLASPKKRKENTYSQNNSDALFQARFCRAVMELQITGLLRMPSKRCPDYVQRVAFGV